MSFVSIEFLLFLPVVFLLYWFVFKPLRWQNTLVLMASYVFYGWWDWRFLGLIALTTVFSYVSGLLISHYEGHRSKQKAVSAVNIILNIGILATFKYFNFFVDSLENLLGAFGCVVDWPTAKIILPVGISFYTFQALSYSIDVYKRKLEPTRDFIAFAAFISFFPQLVAGPIERATNLLPQFQKPRIFDSSKSIDGMRQMLWGLFKKMVIADGCAAIVNPIWADYANYSPANLIVACLLFTFQIYCDFSGYSDIAIGTARLFGIDLMQNFSYPYFACNIQEFWRRWHISLTSWFRDYIYIPLGGNRVSKWRNVANILVVFALSGLWHGANWTFVVWGMYHGMLIALFVLVVGKSRYAVKGSSLRYLPSVRELMAILVTFTLTVFGWLIFRAPTLAGAIDFVRHMFTVPIMAGGVLGAKMLVMCAVLLLVEWLQRDKAHPLMFSSNGFFKFRAVRWLVYYGLILWIYFGQANTKDFIYFQF